jgi:hypothetical protein
LLRVAAYRTHDRAFSRQRVLTFPVLVSFLLCAFKGGLQTLLDELFATLDASGVRAVTKSALSQARQKLKATVSAPAKTMPSSPSASPPRPSNKPRRPAKP